MYRYIVTWIFQKESCGVFFLMRLEIGFHEIIKDRAANLNVSFTD